VHEARLIADLVARADAAVPDDAVAADSVRLELTADTHLDADAVRAQFEMRAEGTRVEGARVIVDASGRCAPGDVILVSVSVRS